MTSLNEYNENIRREIALEFGFEAIGLGANRLDVSKAKEYLAKWNSLSAEEQKTILASRGH